MLIGVFALCSKYVLIRDEEVGINSNPLNKKVHIMKWYL